MNIRRAKLRVAFVRNDRFVTTKNSFLDGIIGNVSDFAFIIKGTNIVYIVIKDIGKRFFGFELINMIKIV